MPELPEVEVVRSGLARHIMGARIVGVEVADPRSLRRHPGTPEQFASALNRAVIRDVCRRGKYMWLRFSSDGEQLDPRGVVVHLGMSGQLLLATADMPPHRHTRITFTLETADGEAVEFRFVDQRIFGGLFLDDVVPVADAQGRPVPAASTSVLDLPEIPQTVAHIGRDPLDPYFDAQQFRRRILRTTSCIKRVLLDQSVISGIGNIYADEALWRARIHYAKPARSLSAQKTRDVVYAATEVMTEALAQGGTSFDALYVNVNGESGYFERGLNVYGRAGLPCKRCGAAIVREPFMNRSSYRCPRCQRRR
ncbi:bifunctional DNA-formamidopyrimidine glycosylase/DNA-(apurinic or apyrimidinic site) lyase [uncultured Kocuria sp.]|uniref:bifunctional DNA-formamidopyrimidine glycosylase/DNA-(apurinic or apyrimidinic site) lyase n=1 Tax=uncultured Kocuria sp. TaxID=259305 RepID=UPI002593C05F|nr:bifunctional DNA-formamidopyrimidine glycosylase/DNA-(apurinic or apyrimidinic site) lyase [uncultured Kocuria sp.]MCT1367358.1 bifunctional DNA-formamidopyrimidine glycosylase/DNA-(apurinic or apyrimidinic site) lyase [Rothia sp. p3-SID1597]